MFYKYRNFYDEKGHPNEHIEGILKEGEMFFAKPSKFEDVHDCEVNLELYAINSILHKYLRDELFPICSPEQKEMLKKKYWGNPKQFQKDFNSGKLIDFSKKSADFMAMLCLCKNPLKAEMWNKYATMGGLCIGYETCVKGNSEGVMFKENFYWEDLYMQKDAGNFLPFYPVLYSDDSHQKINRLPTDRFKKEVKKCFLTKEIKWNFEEEVRSFVYKENLKTQLGNTGIALHCTDDTIKQIIFAEKTDENIIQNVKSIIDSRSCGRNGVQFYKFNENGKRILPLIL